MSECESTRGKWSTPTKTNYCPACKAPMPVDRGPLRSDHAMSNHDQSKVSTTAGMLGNPVMVRPSRRGGWTPYQFSRGRAA